MYLDASFLSWRSKFNPMAFHVEFMVNKVALGQVFLCVLQFPPADYSVNFSYSSFTVSKCVTDQVA